MLRRHLPLALAAAGLLAAAPAASALLLPGTLPSALPVISGTPQPGQTLTCSPGTVYPSGTTYAYSWQRDVLATVGTPSDQYTVTSADIGHELTCTLVASLAGLLPVTTVSQPVTVGSPALPLAPVNSGLPSVTGIAQQGQLVTCDHGTWLNDPTTYTYAWMRGATQVATGSTYTLLAGDVSQAITCQVIAANAVGSSAPAVSLPIIPVAAPSVGGSGPGGSSTGSTGSTGSSGSSGSSGGSTQNGSSTRTSRTPAPRVTAFAVTPRRLVERRRHRRLTSRPISFRYRVSHAATVFILIQRRVKGHWMKVTTLRISLHRAMAARRKFTGRVHRRLLAPGAYRAVIAAVDRGGWSKARTARFRVVRR